MSKRHRWIWAGICALAMLLSLGSFAAAQEETGAILASSQDELSRARAELDKLHSAMIQLADEWEASRESYEAQIAELNRRLEEAEAPEVFAGREIRVRFTVPAGMRALEAQSAIYLADDAGAVSGMIRRYVDEEGEGISPAAAPMAHILEQTLAQIEYPKDALAEVRSVQLSGGEALRFSLLYVYDDGTKGYAEICLLKGGQSYMCFELEGARADRRRIEALMDEFLAAMTVE